VIETTDFISGTLNALLIGLLAWAGLARWRTSCSAEAGPRYPPSTQDVDRNTARLADLWSFWQAQNKRGPIQMAPVPGGKAR
jgi:hypothetical protein